MLPTIHIVNPFTNCAGSEWRAINLARELAGDARITLWSEATPAPQLASEVDIQRITPGSRQPRGGTLIIVGTYFRLGNWLEQAAPERLIVVHNTVGPAPLAKTLDRLQCAGLAAELVYTSHIAAVAGGYPGVVEHSHIDCARFAPIVGRPSTATDFVVGRMSRDVPEKHHPEDPALYQALLAEGIQVDLMGAECIAPQLPVSPDLRLRPAAACPPETFLGGLDCFVFRTDPAWLEPLGRVVLEAMASGLPVVAHRSGGYCELLEDGVHGILFDTTASAVAAVLRLRADPGLRRRLGRAARARVLASSSAAARETWRDFYLGS